MNTTRIARIHGSAWTGALPLSDSFFDEKMLSGGGEDVGRAWHD
jgi:hypothetical protein